MEYPSSFQSKAVSIKLLFQVSPQSSGREDIFEVDSSIADLLFKQCITHGCNINYYKSVNHPIPTLSVRTGNTLAIFKTNQ